MKEQLQQLLQKSLEKLVNDGVIKSAPDNIRIDFSKDKSQGDFASNIAMVLTKQAELPPKTLAQKIVDNLEDNVIIEKIEIAGPGFINFFLSQDSNIAVIEKIITMGNNYGKTDIGKNLKVLLEFVSANPTGPLHVGHGRGAAYGATLSNLLRAVGFEVDCEYYVNDAGRQMDILATSVYLRYVKTDKFPDNGYKGDYILTISKKITKVKKLDIFADVYKDEKDGGDKERHIDDLIKNCKNALGAEYNKVFNFAINEILQDIKDDLADFGVKYQNFFSEKSLSVNNSNNKTIKKLQKSNDIYESGGALWFKTTKYGDEKDRVVVRENGAATYFASDISYHLDKFSRGYDKIINIWGADHHGYIARVKAAITALGFDDNKLEVLLVQFANLYKNGAKLPMSTRSGSFVTLKELRDEVGNDAARFFYILRKTDQHMDFDMDLAKSKTNENPVFYIQYAHARICSVLNKAKLVKNVDFGLLTNKYEKNIIKNLNRFEEVVKNSAINYEPHILAYYLRDLSSDFHSYYNNCEFLIADEALKNARLSLITAIRQIIKNGLGLLGVSSPDKM